MLYEFIIRKSPPDALRTRRRLQKRVHQTLYVVQNNSVGNEQEIRRPTDRCVRLPAEEEVARGYLQRRPAARSGPVADVPIFSTGVLSFPVYLGN